MFAVGLRIVGWNLAMTGQQALGFCEQSLALNHQLGDKHTEPVADLGSHYQKAETLIYAGDAHHASGDVPAAHDAWTQALAILDDLRHPDAEQVRTKLRQLATRRTHLRQCEAGPTIT
jgi:hypothetical protein